MGNSNLICINNGSEFEIKFSNSYFDVVVDFKSVGFDGGLVFNGELMNSSLDLEVPFNNNAINVSTELVIKDSALNDIFVFNLDSVFFESYGEVEINIKDSESKSLIYLFSVDIDVVGEFKIDFSDGSGQSNFNFSSVSLNLIDEFKFNSINSSSDVNFEFKCSSIN